MVTPTHAFDEETRRRIQDHALPGSIYDAPDLGLISSQKEVVIENRLGPALRIDWDQARSLHEMLGTALRQPYAPEKVRLAPIR